MKQKNILAVNRQHTKVGTNKPFLHALFDSCRRPDSRDRYTIAMHWSPGVRSIGFALKIRNDSSHGPQRVFHRCRLGAARSSAGACAWGAWRRGWAGASWRSARAARRSRPPSRRPGAPRAPPARPPAGSAAAESSSKRRSLSRANGWRYGNLAFACFHYCLNLNIDRGTNA